MEPSFILVSKFTCTGTFRTSGSLFPLAPKHIHPGRKSVGSIIFSSITDARPTSACPWCHLHPESSDATARPSLQTIPVLRVLGLPSVSGCRKHCCNSASSRGWGVCVQGAVRAEIIPVGIVPKPRNVLPVPIKRFCFASGFKEQSGRQCSHAKTLEFWIFGFLWE